MKHLHKYVDYINNTGRKPLPISAFDDDWEPVGPMIRADMQAAGLIYYGGRNLPFPVPEGIYLRPDLDRSRP